MMLFRLDLLFTWFLLAEAECVMSYPSIVEVDYIFCLLVKQQLNCFVIKKYEFINGMKISVV